MEFNPDESAFLRMLAGNLVTAGALWLLLDLNDTNALRAVHPLVHDALNQVPMHWVEPVMVSTALGMRRLKECYPSAAFVMNAYLHTPSYEHGPMLRELPLHVTSLELLGEGVTDDVVRYLPSQLRKLHMCGCNGLTKSVSFAHLPNLIELDCGFTGVRDESIASLPHTVRKLILNRCAVELAGMSLAFLEELDCSFTDITDRVIASLSSRVRRLNIHWCRRLRDVSFAHLTSIVELNCSGMIEIYDKTIASIPSSVQKLDVTGCHLLTTSVSFEHLTSLTELRCCNVNISESTVLTLPISLLRLWMSGCDYLTKFVSFAHLTRLKELQCGTTDLGDAAIGTIPSSILVLVVCGTVINMTELVSFAHLTKLEELNCWGTRVSDAAISTLQPSVKKLHLSSSNVTDAVSFSHLPNLMDLNCSYTEVGNVAISTLPPSIQCLTVRAIDLKRTTFSHLPALKLLECTGEYEAAFSTLPVTCKRSID